MSELHVTRKTKLMVDEEPKGSPIYLDRLKKIIKTPANERPTSPPETLGSPSDRGPVQVPKIIKDDVMTKVKKKLEKESLGQNTPDIGNLQTEDKLIGPNVIQVDIPTFIRIMELAREQIRRDEDIHIFTAALLDYGKKIITMKEYMQAIRTIGK